MRRAILLALILATASSCKKEPQVQTTLQETGAGSSASQDKRARILTQTIEVKVLTIPLMEFGSMEDERVGEAQMWVTAAGEKDESKKMTLIWDMPGAFGSLYCSPAGHCLVLGGMGSVNVTATLMAIAMNPRLDLSKTYFMLAGVAGGNPNYVTLGSVVWANYLVDTDASYHIEGRDLTGETSNENGEERPWPSHFHLGCPLTTWCDGVNEGWSTGTETFALNKQLTARAVEISKRVQLEDAPSAMAFRELYGQRDRKSDVQSCDVASGLAFFHGEKMGQWVEEWMKKWTKDGKYCATAMEETGTAAALHRFKDVSMARFKLAFTSDRPTEADANTMRVDVNRIMVVRGIANYERQPPEGAPLAKLEQTIEAQGFIKGPKFDKNRDGRISALESLQATAQGKSGGLDMAVINVYRAGRAVADEIVANWEQWKNGVPH